jgi:hypothetical protein
MNSTTVNKLFSLVDQDKNKGMHKNKLWTKFYTLLQFFFSLTCVILENLWQSFYNHNRSYKCFFETNVSQKWFNPWPNLIENWIAPTSFSFLFPDRIAFDTAVIGSGLGRRPLIFWGGSLINHDSTVRHNYLNNPGRTKLAVCFQIRSDVRKTIPVTMHALCSSDPVIYTSKNIRSVNKFEVFEFLECFTASSVGSLFQTRCSETSVLNYQLTLQKNQKNEYHFYTPAIAQILAPIKFAGKRLYINTSSSAYLFVLCLFNCSRITIIKSLSFCMTIFSACLVNSRVFVLQSCDGSCYVSRPILALLPTWLQKYNDLRAHDFAPSSDLHP